MTTKYFRVLLFGICMSFLSGMSQAATVIWDGGGADNNWSTAANWSGDSVPTGSDDVIFDGTSSKSSTIDFDVTVGSLSISSAYTGTVSLGSNTLTVSVGNLDLSNGGIDPGTGTVKFTGTAEQWFKYVGGSTYYNVENANTGSGIVFGGGGYSLSVNQFKALAGTTTKLPNGTMTAASLDVQGTAGNLAVLRSCYTSAQTLMNLTSGNQTISYADIINVNASSGFALDATSNCVDSGNNVNVNFSSYKIWDGGGADNNWSTAANWSGDTVPVSTSSVVFDGTSAKDCTLDGDVELASLEIKSDYTGTLSAGSHIITINSGNVNFAADRFNAGTGTLKFTAVNEQRLEHVSGATVYNIENAQTGGFLRFGSGTFTANQLKVMPGTTTKLADYILYVSALDLQGVSGNPATVKCRYESAARLIFSGTQTISYVDFRYMGYPLDSSTHKI